MKKLFLSILFVFACIAMANAVPAQPGWHTFIQSDGKAVTLQLVGDEWSSATLTRDGLMATRGDDGDFYYYSSLTGQTAVRAHDVEHRTAVETSFIEAQHSQFKFQYQYQQPKVSSFHHRFNAPLCVGKDEANPCIGNRIIPVILVQYQDIKFKSDHNRDFMQNEVNKVTDYFYDQSNGKYSPNFVVFGPYTLDKNRSYYGGDKSENEKDTCSAIMAIDAIKKFLEANESFDSFSTYNPAAHPDFNCLDALIVIYAGPGQSANGATTDAIWPHRSLFFNESLGRPFHPSEDIYNDAGSDPYIYQYAEFNELSGASDAGTQVDGIGTFCHEFSHCLGLPDFYDVDYNKDWLGRDKYFHMGNWSIMAHGCYNNNSRTPIGYNAYEKNFMGWVNYTYATPGTTYTLPKWNIGNDKAVCIQSDFNNNEYFIYEYRHPISGGWDEYIPDQKGGLMVTHVSYVPDRWNSNKVNNEKIQLMTILPADNDLSLDSQDKDLWPKGSNNELTNESSPATVLYLDAVGGLSENAGLLGKPVKNIRKNVDGTISFDFMPESATDLCCSTSNLNLGTVKYGTKRTATLVISGRNLTEDVKLSITGKNADKFSVNKTTIPIAPVCTDQGYSITVTYTALNVDIALFTHNATLNIESGSKKMMVNLTAKSSVFGDEDGDGKFNIDDVTAVISYLLSGEDSPYSGKMSIDDVTALINYLLSGETSVDLEDGLVAYYPLDGNALDMSGNGNHGIATNITPTTGVTGKQEGAYYFGGTDNPGYIRVPNSSSLQFSDGFTFSCFVKPMDWKGMNGTGSVVANGNHCIFAKSSDQTGPAMMFSGEDDGLHVWCVSSVDQCQWFQRLLEQW